MARLGGAPFRINLTDKSKLNGCIHRLKNYPILDIDFLTGSQQAGPKPHCIPGELCSPDPPALKVIEHKPYGT